MLVASSPVLPHYVSDQNARSNRLYSLQQPRIWLRLFGRSYLKLGSRSPMFSLILISNLNL